MKSTSLHVRTASSARVATCVAALALAAATSSCKTGSGTSGGPARGSELDASTRVLEIDGQAVTYGDLKNDKEVGPQLKAAEVKAQSDLADARSQAAESMLRKRLLEGAAKAKGKSVEEYLKTDFAAEVPDPTDAEIQKFYDENRARIPQVPFEQLKPQIAQYLKGPKLQEKLDQTMAKLQEQHKAQVVLEPLRLPVEAKGPVRGPETAKVTIVEFSDFECPFCGREIPVVEKVLKEYDGKVKLYFRHFPLTTIHKSAEKAAEAAVCAQEQGKFWELHDTMFTHQQQLAVTDLKDYAKKLGLDSGKFDKCLDSGAKKALVDADQAAGTEAGVNGTPGFFIDGIFINGAKPFEDFKKIIDRELKSKG